MLLLSRWLLLGIVISCMAACLPASSARAAGAPPTPAPAPAALRFRHLKSDDGLPNNRVAAMLQDRRGFMWFGTSGGLARYDGYRVISYKQRPDDPSSLSNNIVTALAEDRSGAIWVGTREGGLNRFDPDKQTFKPYRPRPGAAGSPAANNVGALAVDPAGTLWLAAGGQLQRFDQATETFASYAPPPCGPNAPIRKIAPAPDGLLWLAGGGLLKFDPRAGAWACYQPKVDAAPNTVPPPDQQTQTPINDVYAASAEQLWLGSDRGLYRFDVGAEQFTLYQPAASANDAPAPDGLIASRGGFSVHSIAPDPNGRLWIGTVINGLLLFDPQTQTFAANYRPDPINPDSISAAPIDVLFHSREDVVWLGTAFAGVDRLDLWQSQFTLYRRNPVSSNSFLGVPMRAIAQDAAGIIWVGSADRLTRFDPQRGEFKHYTPSTGPRPGGNAVAVDINAIFPDNQGGIWFDGINGIDRFDTRTETFEAYHPAGRPGGQLIISGMAEDQQHNLWAVALDSDVLYQFDRASRQFKAFPVSTGGRRASLRAVAADPAGDIWVGGVGFLSHFDRRTGQFTNYAHDSATPTSLPAVEIQSIHADRQGNLWLATSGGLVRFEPATAKSTVFAERDGLPSTLVQAVLEDRQGQLWASTARGIARLDPNTGAIRTYDISDGLQGNEFTAAGMSPNGRLMFGGSNGLSSFVPEQIADRPFQPAVVLTDIELFNQPVPIGGDSFLQSAIASTPPIVLHYDQSIFSLEFAALSYAAPEHNRYRYKLEGFERDWNVVGSDRRFVTYTSLPPGQYTFRVQGSNDDWIWSDQEVALQITILPPWWDTWWFRILVAVLIVACVLGGFHWRMRAVERRSRQLEQQVAERTHELMIAKVQAEAASQAKTEFLANISHELRTPLNGILGYAQILRRDPDLSAAQQEGLHTIHESGRHLLMLINDILDLSKIEARKLELTPQPLHLPTFLDGIAGIIAMAAREKGIAFVYQPDPALPPTIVADEKRLRQVLLNLLGNAVKFTERGTVTLRVRADQRPPTTDQPEDKQTERLGDQEHHSDRLLSQSPDLRASLSKPSSLIRFEVADTGIGIAPEQLDRIFEPFEQAGSAQQRAAGTGLGLAISQRLIAIMGGRLQVRSQPGQGSTFWFAAPFELEASGMTPELPAARLIRGYHGPRRRILVVDDRQENRMVFKNLLEPLGFEVLLAEHGRQGVECAQKVAPDLIFMDLVMPVMMGFEAVLAIRQIPGLANLPIIAVSASMLDMDGEASRQVGFDGFLSKPIDAEAVLEQIGRRLGLAWFDTPGELLGSHGPAAASPAADMPMIAPPQAELEVLYELARFGNMARIKQHALHLEQLSAHYRPFARQVHQLADAFDDEAIQRLVQQHLNDNALVGVEDQE